MLTMLRRLVGPLAVGLVVLWVAVVTIWAPDWWRPMVPLLTVLRAANPWLAVAAVVLLSLRVTEAWAERPRREQFGHLLFIGYIAAAALGTVQASVLDAPVGPTTAVLTVLHLGTITLMLAWSRLAPAVTPTKETTS